MFFIIPFILSLISIAFILNNKIKLTKIDWFFIGMGGANCLFCLLMILKDFGLF